MEGIALNKTIYLSQYKYLQTYVTSIYISCQQYTFVYMLLTSAVASGSVPVIPALADATVGALSVVKTLLALSGTPVASIHVRHVDVVVALAWLAAPTWLGGVAIITRGTILTSRAYSRKEGKGK